MDFERRHRFKSTSVKAREYFVMLGVFMAITSPFILIEGLSYLSKYDLKVNSKDAIIGLTSLIAGALMVNSRLQNTQILTPTSEGIQDLEWPRTVAIKIDPFELATDTYRRVPVDFFDATRRLNTQPILPERQN